MSPKEIDMVWRKLDKMDERLRRLEVRHAILWVIVLACQGGMAAGLKFGWLSGGG